MRILAINGSRQAKSSNRTLLETAQRAAPAEVTVELFDGLRDLPHFEQAVAALLEVLIATIRAPLRRELSPTTLMSGSVCRLIAYGGGG